LTSKTIYVKTIQSNLGYPDIHSDKTFINLNKT